MSPDDRESWKRLAAVLRESGVVARESGEPPPGLATRVLAARRRERRADATGRVLWRRWTLAAAGLSCAGVALLAFTLPDPAPQILPLPEIDFPAP